MKNRCFFRFAIEMWNHLKVLTMRQPSRWSWTGSTGCMKSSPRRRNKRPPTSTPVPSSWGAHCARAATSSCPPPSGHWRWETSCCGSLPTWTQTAGQSAPRLARAVWQLSCLSRGRLEPKAAVESVLFFLSRQVQQVSSICLQEWCFFWPTLLMFLLRD